MPTKRYDSRAAGAARQYARESDKPAGVPERILDAALAILAESGLRNLTQVQVANRAKVRQSHLTYYFPTRDDLLDAVTARAADGIASGLRRVAKDSPKGGQGALLERLARSVADFAHMRMFLALMVEADADPAVRRVMKRATERIETALAQSLGGDDADERAPLVLAAIWGLGLYQFLMRPASNASSTRAYLSWLVGASRGSKSADRRRSDHQ